MTCPRIASRLRSYSVAASAATVLAGLLVLAGWGFGIASLKSVLPDHASMRPNAAVRFVLAGLSLGLRRKEDAGRRERYLALAAALGAAAIGLATFSQHLFGWDLGIDQLLFREEAGALGSFAPGRMAPTTALNFVVLGLALLLLDVETRGGRRPAELLSLLATFVSLLGFLGYLYDVPELYSLESSTQMAFPTVVLFVALSLGILLARPERGLMAIVSSDSLGGAVARRLLPAAVAIPIVVGWLRIEGERAGLHGAAFGLAAVVFSNVVLFSLLVWANAVPLHRLDSERREAEQAVRESEERFRATFDHSAVGIAHVAPDGHFLRLNRKFCEIVRYAPEELLAMSFQDITHPDDLETDLSHVRLVLAGAIQTYSMEKRYIRKDGGLVWINLTVSLVRGTSGEPKYFISVVEDISARKRAEETIERFESRYRAIFDFAPLGIYLSRPDGAIMAANVRLAHLLGYPSVDDLLKVSMQDLYVRKEERGDLIGRYEPLGGVIDLDVQWRRKDGSPVPIQLSAHTMKDETGAIVGYEGFVRDITGQKRAEEKRERLEAQLRQSQKMEAIGQLAGGVAHDFNNLLGVITGYADLLLKDLGTQHPGYRRAEQIRKAADRAAALTRQLLAFSRRQLLQPKVLDLNTVVGDVEGMLRRLIGEDIQLVTVLGSDLGHVRADPSQIEQVIVNLAVNARDAMPDGGTLTIETSRVALDEGHARSHPGAAAGPHVVLAVTDTGHGMDAEVLSHIFEPFFTTKGPAEGTGLGLATVYGIVQQSGGHVEVQSEPARGSTFRIYLPRSDSDRTETAEPERHARGAAASSGSETVLLLEDEEALRAMICEVLEEGGYVVLQGSSAEEALSAASVHRSPIHLLLTDVVMPRISGRDAAARLRAQRPEVKVLYMSGYTDLGRGQRSALVPEAHFLQKPFTASALLRKIREVLDSSRLEKSGEVPARDPGAPAPPTAGSGPASSSC